MRRFGPLARRPVRPAPLAGRVLAHRASFLARVAGRVAHPPLLGGTTPGPWTRVGLSWLAQPVREGAGETGDLALSPRLVGRVAAAVARWLAPAGVLGRLPSPVTRGDPSVVAARAMAFAREVAARAAPADAPRPGATPPVRFDHPGAPSGIPAAADRGAFDPASIMRRIEAKRRGEPAPVAEIPASPRRDVVPGAALPPTVRVTGQGDVIAAAGRAVSPVTPTMTYLRPDSRGGDGDAASPRAERARGRPLPPPGDAAEIAPSPARRARAVAAGDAAASPSPAPPSRGMTEGVVSAPSVPPVTGTRPVLPASEAAPIHPAVEAHPLHSASDVAPMRPLRTEPTAPGLPPSPIIHLARPSVEGDREIAPPAASPPRAESPAREIVRGEPVQPSAEVMREIVREVVRAEPVVPLPASSATRAMRSSTAQGEGDVVRAAPVRPTTTAPGVPASGWLAPATVMMRAVRAAERVAAATAPAAPQGMPVTARVAAPGAVRPGESAATRATALAQRIAERGTTTPHPAAARPGIHAAEGITIPGLPGPVLHPQPRRVDEAETRRVVERVLGRFEAPRSPSPESPEEGDRGERDEPRIHIGRVVGEREMAIEHAPVDVGPSIGFALPARLREGMRALLGFDPGAARIHTGDAAARAARRLGAAAFTVGSDVFFAPGRYAPETRGGLALLAHELAHVRQQAGRPFRHGEVTPARRAALEAEARASEARVHAPRPEATSTRAWPPVAVSFAPLAAPAAPMLAAEESAPAAEAPQAGQPAATAAAQGAHPAGAPQTAGASTEAIAEEVYRLIRDRMRIERERRGIQPWA